ncbi:MAG: hypothetical protein H7Z42_15315 [Roseiflexaceae bacterium]|nr:hypothetical protein [Roseiflexaceae bacterium]
MHAHGRLTMVSCTLGLVVALSRTGTYAPAAPALFAANPHRAAPFTPIVASQPVRLPSTSLPMPADNKPQADTPTPTRTPTPITVGNFVWDDADGDGRQDAGEPGLSSITVQLWNGNKTQLLASTTTNTEGLYSLVAPTPGMYRVRVVLANAGDQFTLQDAAVGDTLDSDINPAGSDAGFTDMYDFGSNLISITSIDAGIRVYSPPTPTRTPTPITLGNFVWHDLNGDGVQQTGEPGVAGVSVQLWNSAKTQLLGAATTSDSGSYTLIAPIAGDYRIRVLLPSGASFAPKNQASDTLDSDVNTFGLNLSFTDVITIGSNVISISNIDAGLLNVQPTPTPSSTGTPTNTPTPPSGLQPDLRISLPIIQQ